MLVLRPASLKHADRKVQLREGKNWVMSNAIMLM